MNKELDFIRLLIEEGIISDQTAKVLVEKFKYDYFSILLYLVDSKIATKKKLGRLWGDSLGVAYTELKKAMFQKEVVQKLSEEFARKNKVILIYQLGKVIIAATPDPKNDILLNKIEQLTKSQVSTVFSFPDEIDEAIDKYYLSYDSLEGLTKNFSINKDKINVNEMPSVISEKTKEYLINSTKNIAQQAYEGKTPDLEVCKDVGNTIIEEVNQKLEIIHCINQLRINDEYTYSHSVNVAMLSSAIGKALGFSANLVKELVLGALLHDIGKMRIPKVILNKPDKLDKEEIALIKRHPVLGYQIVTNMGIPEKISEIVYNHHERIDGNGYPRGLARDELSINVQIVSIVDVYDALVSDRPYKAKMAHHEALNIILLEGQRAFDFDLLYKFVNLVYKENFDTLKKTFKSVLYGEIT